MRTGDVIPYDSIESSVITIDTSIVLSTAAHACVVIA